MAVAEFEFISYDGCFIFEFEITNQKFNIMKKHLLTALSVLTALSTYQAQFDSTSFSVLPAVGMTQAQYITVPINSTLQFTDEFTLECWVFVPNTSSQEIHLIETYFGNSGGYALRLTQTNKVKGFAMGASQPVTTGATTVSTNTWNHVAVTYATTTGALKVYLNGVLDGTTTPNSAIYTNTATLKIGSRGDDSDVNDDILMDEVRLWNVARSETQLANSMNNCLSGNETGLVLYYDFEDEQVSGAVTDRTANSNDGTIVSNTSPYGPGVFECFNTSQIYENESIQLDVYPNPSSSILNVQSNLTINQIKIFNLLGELVQSEKQSTFSIEQLPDGIYVLQIQTESGLSNQRFVKG